MLGRMANFVNGELWGRVTSVPWAVIFPNSPAQYSAVLDSYGPAPRHPSQLYQAGLEGAVLFAYLQVRFWRGSAPKGHIAGEFLIAYALFTYNWRAISGAGRCTHFKFKPWAILFTIFADCWVDHFIRSTQKR